MSMRKDEMEMLKAVSMKVGDNHIMIVTEQYHAEKTDDGKRNPQKSMYRWFAKVLSIDEWQAKIDDMFSDEKRLERYKIPNDNLDYYLTCNKDSTNYSIANWLENKVKKAKSWEDGQKILKGYKNKTANHDALYNPGAVYPVEGYKAENGDLINITDVDALIKHAGQNLVKYIKG